MSKIKPRTLSGFMELLPEKQAAFERIAESLRQTYSLYGFAPLDTPVIEASEILLAKAGGETEKQIYRFTKGDTDLSLRFDLTVPLAKYVAMNYEQLAFPFRRYQIGKVYRGERAQRGRFREFYQADIDIIGDGELSIMNEAEIPAIIYRTFSALGLEKFKIRVNNRKVLNGFFAMHGLTERAAELMRIIDKLDKIGGWKGLELLIEAGIKDDTAREIMHLVLAFGSPVFKLESPKDFCSVNGIIDRSCYGNVAYRLGSMKDFCGGKNETFDAGLTELKTVAEYLPRFGVPEANFEIDLTIARGLDYYTGTVYETVLTNHPEIGSVCSGGRYDDLAGYYTDKKLPGVGISIGLTRLFYILEEQNMLSGEQTCAPADVLVIPMTDDLSRAVETATFFRSAGIRAQLYCEDKKFKAKMSYADKTGVPFVALLGEDELAKNVVAVKDMISGEQLTLSVADAADLIRRELVRRSGGKIICD